MTVKTTPTYVYEANGDSFSLWCLLSTMTSSVEATSFSMDDETIMLEQGHRDKRLQALNLRDVRAQEREVKVNFSGLAFCPKNMERRKSPNESDDDVIPKLSTCPWVWQLNFDPQRQPSTIMTAVCTCKHCLRTSIPSRCVPVHYFRNVIYFPGTESEVTKVYRVAVGCTCERYPKQSPGSKKRKRNH